MGTYKKPVHSICVDKTSCRQEAAENEKQTGAQVPTEHLTKDFIRKAYENSGPKA